MAILFREQRTRERQVEVGFADDVLRQLHRGKAANRKTELNNEDCQTKEGKKELERYGEAVGAHGDSVERREQRAAIVGGPRGETSEN